MKKCDYDEKKLEWKEISSHGLKDYRSSVKSVTYIAKVFGGWLIKEVSVHGQGIAPSLQYIPDPEYKMESIYNTAKSV